MNENKELFEERPVSKAVISLVVPTVISQLITVAYNMADTFLSGRWAIRTRWRQYPSVCRCLSC